MTLDEMFFALHARLPRQSPGSDATTRLALTLAGPPARPRRAGAGPRVLDIGCGPGRAALLLAREAGAEVTAIDLHEPFLDELTRSARAAGLDGRIRTAVRSMTDLRYPDESFDLVWAEGSAYIMGFDEALRAWRRLIAPGGTLMISEVGWTVPEPSRAARDFWSAAYPLRSTAANITAAQAAGYQVLATYLQPDSDWWDEYYDPLGDRLERAGWRRPGGADDAGRAGRAELGAAASPAAPVAPAAADPGKASPAGAGPAGAGPAGAEPGTRGPAAAEPAALEVLRATAAEIELRRHHGHEYGYTCYLLTPRKGEPAGGH